MLPLSKPIMLKSPLGITLYQPFSVMILCNNRLFPLYVIVLLTKLDSGQSVFVPSIHINPMSNQEFVNLLPRLLVAKRAQESMKCRPILVIGHVRIQLEPQESTHHRNFGVYHHAGVVKRSSAILVYNSSVRPMLEEG